MVEQTAERILKFKIIIATNEALANLAALVRSTDTYNKKIEALKKLIVEFAKIHNISIRDAALQLQQFQNLLFDPSKARTPFADAIRDLGQEAEKTETKTRSLGDVLKTALGFTLGSFVVSAIRKAINVLKEMLQISIDMEMQMFRLRVAIIGLTRAGTSASMQQFQRFIKALSEEFEIFSQVAITSATAATALLTREFGFTQAQIEETVRVGAVLASFFEKDLTESVQALTLAMTTGSFRGLNRLGTGLSQAAVNARALEMGLDQSIEQMDLGTKASIILGLALESTAEIQDQAGDVLDTAAGKQKRLAATWEDFSRVLGNIFTPAWKEVLDALNSGLLLADQLIIIFKVGVVEALASVAAGAIGVGIAFNMMKENIFGDGEFTVEDFLGAMFAARGQLVESFRTALGLDELGEGVAEDLDGVGEAIDAEAQEIEDIIKKLADAIEREMLRMQQRTEELNLKFAQRLETLELQFSQRRQRIIEDFALRREKTNRQFDVRAAEAARKFRQREEEEERKFQERLIRLREKFLFDLEDAVRERDARQVLRLIRRFNMEKGQIERQQQEEDQTRDERFREEMAAIERQRAERLLQLDIDEQMRLQHLAQDHALEMRQAEERHRQQLEQLQRQTENRLELVALGLLQEHEITKEGLDAIMDTLLEQFGPSGLVESIYSFMIQRVAQTGAHMVRTFGGVLSTMAQMIGSVRFAPAGVGTGGSALPMAEGGTVIASRPTLAMFGERGLERATFTPLGRAGMNVGRTMGDMPAGTGGGEGKLTVEVMLDPNLQTKIVDESMGRVANVITNVRRSQQ